VWGAVALLKSDKTPSWLTPPVAYRPLVAFALGQGYAVLEAVVHGMPWGSAVVRGVVVAAIAIGGQELGSKLKNGAPPIPPAGAAGLGALALVILSSSGCTPHQAQTAASIAKVAAKIGGAVCNMVDKNDKTARFVCSLVDEGSSVLGNMSTTEAADFHRRTAAHFEVAHLASIVEECGEHDQPCCARLRKEFTNALRCAGVPRALKEITERAAKVDVAAELPAAVEASDADTDTPHRIESER
jgi:hypothetical protein